MRTGILAILTLLLLAVPADAQRNCVKGKPCGNTCIARTSTCRVGTGSARQAPRAAPPASPAPAAPADARFIASSRGQVYYVIGCSGARALVVANRIYFKTEEEAQAAGYRPSTARGCSTGSAVAAAPTPESPPPPGGGEAAPVIAGECVISRVYDGDTVTCRTGESLRLLLIDAPEMDQGEFGRMARNALLEMAPLGSTVHLELDVEQKDRYDRVLAYLWLPDGRLLNEELVRSGYAVGLTYPPNVRYVERIEAAVAEARDASRGLWSVQGFECAPVDHRAKRCE